MLALDPAAVVPITGAGAVFIVMLRMLWAEIGNRRLIEEALRKEWADERRQTRQEQTEIIAVLRVNHAEDVAVLRERVASLETTVISLTEQLKAAHS